MDGPALGAFSYLLAFVDGLTKQIEHSTQTLFAYRHTNRCAGIGGFHTTPQAIGGTHGDAANHIIANVLGNFRHHQGVCVFDLNGIEKVGQLPIRETEFFVVPMFTRPLFRGGRW